MAVPDRQWAAHCLLHIGYYRLSSYWRPFQAQSLAGNGSTFREGAEFGDVIEHYKFDGYLRSTLAEALGQIEVSARALWAGHLADEGGDQAHLKPALFTGERYWQHLDDLKQSYRRTAEWQSPEWDDATIWEVAEAMSFGQLSKWYNAILLRRIRNEIAQHHRMNHVVLSSILFNMAHLRNICAHHGRLWNRNFYTGLRIPNALAKYCNEGAKERLYNRLVMITHLMGVIDLPEYWKGELVDLMASYPAISKESMGFLDNWKEMEFWR
jgi:abortive infection bacteriophage resistance protein